jgi:hypothetical protein
MKKIITVGLMLSSLNAFSQSYLILNNGVTLTLDKAGYVYDFGHFRIPYKVTVNGGLFHVEDKKLSTVDSAGFLYEKDMKIDKIKGKGLNFLIKDDSHLVTIDSKGFYYEYDKDDKIFKKATAFGGNFFLVKENSRKNIVDLYTVNDKGNYFKIEVAGLNPADITTVGGTFFQTKNGVVYTVSKDGFVYAKPEIKVGTIVKAGGNYLIDSTNKIYTVTEDGFLMLPILPANIKVSLVQKLGSNYMIDSEGQIFVVDEKGNMHERSVAHDLSNTKILSI